MEFQLSPDAMTSILTVNLNIAFSNPFRHLQLRSHAMATKRDYYEVLSVKREASDEGDRLGLSQAGGEVPSRYAIHGDEDATDKFKEAAEAYEVLCDADKRARYDRYGHAGVQGQHHEFQSPRTCSRSSATCSAAACSAISSAAGRGGRRRAARRRYSRRGDARSGRSGPRREAERGVRIATASAKTCNGTGAEPGSKKETCRRCGGHGPGDPVGRHPASANHLSYLPAARAP